MALLCPAARLSEEALAQVSVEDLTQLSPVDLQILISWLFLDAASAVVNYLLSSYLILQMAEGAKTSLFCSLSGAPCLRGPGGARSGGGGGLWCANVLSLQVQHLDALSGDDLLLTGEVSWRPLVESNARSILKPLGPVYNDEGL